jgi:hypothetical protein
MGWNIYLILALFFSVFAYKPCEGTQKDVFYGNQWSASLKLLASVVYIPSTTDK